VTLRRNNNFGVTTISPKGFLLAEIYIKNFVVSESPRCIIGGMMRECFESNGKSVSDLFPILISNNITRAIKNGISAQIQIKIQSKIELNCGIRLERGYINARPGVITIGARIGDYDYHRWVLKCRSQKEVIN